MKPEIILIDLIRKVDERGLLAEISPEIKDRFKHMFMATIKPNFSRGNHYHKRKTEWLLAITGKVKVTLTDINSRKESQVSLDANQPQLLVVLPNINVKVENNTKKEATILAIFDEVFDDTDPDVWALKG